MTEHNLFDEVREDLERQKLQALWNRYGVWLIVAALAVVIGTGGTTSYNSWKANKDQALTAELLAATQTKDHVKSLELLQKFADAHAGSQLAVLGSLQAGALAADQNDKAKAIQIFDAVAADTRNDTVFRQLGDLFSVQLQMDNGDPASLSARLQPLTADRATWRFSALEAQGYLALRAGDNAKAKQIFTDLSQNASTPQSMSARAADIARSLN
jgi:hypothetical protein